MGSDHDARKRFGTRNPLDDTMHWKRWLTSLILLPPLLFGIIKGGPLVFLLIAIVVSSITLWEFYQIAFRGQESTVPKVFPILGLFTGALILIIATYHQRSLLLPLIVVNMLAAAFVSIFYFKTRPDIPVIVIKQVFGVVYIPVLLSFCVLIYAANKGSLWFTFLLCVVALGDTCAFYIGTYLGRHKLCPAVSPKKSIEGAIGGLAGSVIFGLLFNSLFLRQIGPGECIGLSLALGIAGQAGDLFESEFKRAVGVKDSGAILPGHGGFLDRLDALLFAAPVAFLIKEYVLL